MDGSPLRSASHPRRAPKRGSNAPQLDYFVQHQIAAQDILLAQPRIFKALRLGGGPLIQFTHRNRRISHTQLNMGALYPHSPHIIPAQLPHRPKPRTFEPHPSR